jgi:hypothetical protein
MIDRLRAGMRLMLPSGNIVKLMIDGGAEWVCEYTEIARARGAVNLSKTWLRRCALPL